MKRRDDRLLLADIQTSIGLAQSYIAGMALPDLVNDSKTMDALVKRIEVIGEAAFKLSKNTRDMAPEVPWDNIIGMRHKLVHDYFGIDAEFVWRTATTRLDQLRDSVEALLGKLQLLP